LLNGAALAVLGRMNVAHIATAIAVFVTGLLPSSCTKTSSTTKAAPLANAVSVNSNEKNLGELSLTNHYETCVQLGAGKSCRIVPSVIDRKNIRLTMTLESKKTNGKTEGLNVIQVVTRTGKSFEVAVGDMNLTLTPNLAE
jgi:hypothetical protein